MTLHEICQQAGNTRCSCGATAGRPCACGPGRYHLSRIARARASGLITAPDFASVISDADVYTGTTTIHDPGAVTA